MIALKVWLALTAANVLWECVGTHPPFNWERAAERSWFEGCGCLCTWLWLRA